MFRYIREKHGQEVLRHVRPLEDNKSCLIMIEADISFIKTSKTEKLIPIFAKVKLLINNVNRKLQYKMAKLVM